MMERKFENKGANRAVVTEKDAKGRVKEAEFTGHDAVKRAHQYYKLLDILNDERTTRQ